MIIRKITDKQRPQKETKRSFNKPEGAKAMNSKRDSMPKETRREQSKFNQPKEARREKKPHQMRRVHNQPKETRRGQSSIVKSETTLLAYLFELLSHQSKSSVKSLLKHGQVSVNGNTATHFDTPLVPGDKVFISHEKGQVVFNHPQLKIVWEDEELIVVNKKDGLLSVSDSPTQERTAYFLLNEYAKKINPRNRIFILHRLDRGTSGLMMFAKNKNIQEYLRENWHETITRRTYVALIEGTPEKKEDTIISYLAENNRMKVFCTDPQNGKEAVSHYHILKNNAEYSLLEVDLETGRKNQIRAQMEFIGHPVAGDPKYGALTDPAGRLMLHARRLFFIHPATNQEMRFETPVPPQFREFVK